MTMLPSNTSTTAPMTAVTSVLISKTPSIGSLLVNRLTTYPPRSAPTRPSSNSAAASAAYMVAGQIDRGLTIWRDRTHGDQLISARHLLRGRRFWSLPEHVGNLELALFLFVPAALPLIFGGQWQSATGQALRQTQQIRLNASLFAREQRAFDLLRRPELSYEALDAVLATDAANWRDDERLAVQVPLHKPAASAMDALAYAAG